MILVQILILILQLIFFENDPFKYTDLYFQLKEKLEDLLKRHIDLVELRGVKNRYFKKELDETKIMIYGQ